MFRFSSFAAAPALVILMGGTAHAALTADQVWQSWKDGAALAGLTVTAATEANAGGVLTLNGVTIKPEGEPVPFTISDMTLTEESDGSVTIRPGATMGIDISEGRNLLKVAVAHDGLTITAREDGSALVYDFAAPKLGIDFNYAGETAALAEGQEKPLTTTSGAVSMEGLKGSWSDTAGTNRAFGLDLTSTKFVYGFTSDNPGVQMKTTSHSETVDFSMGHPAVDHAADDGAKPVRFPQDPGRRLCRGDDLRAGRQHRVGQPGRPDLPLSDDHHGPAQQGRDQL